ncbi:hypothetical protein BH10PSE19_BH10PSE19_16010 [soil metagenome]
MNIKTKILLPLTAIVMAVSLSACNTMKGTVTGMGKDVQATDRALTEAGSHHRSTASTHEQQAAAHKKAYHHKVHHDKTVTKDTKTNTTKVAN